MCARGLDEVALFLSKALASVRSVRGKRWLIVSGNDACDLDSTACAVAYAYFKNQKLGEAVNVLPLCNINRADMTLRTEVTYWLKQCGLSWERLIYADDLFGPHSDFSTQLHNFVAVDLVLVDHHLTTGELARTGWPVKEVIDHHQLDPKAPDVSELLDHCELKLIEPVGSCASLVATQILQECSGESIPDPIWKLLYGALLIDTVGISREGELAGRLTELDFRMANRIEDFIGKLLFSGTNSRESLFANLESAKFDIKGLSTWDLLRRDTKLAAAADCSSDTFLCSTVSGLDFEALIRSTDFIETARRMCLVHTATLLVCITVGHPISSNGRSIASNDRLTRRKGLFIFDPGNNEALMNRLADYLLLPDNGLDLNPETNMPSNQSHLRIVGVIQNPKATRKAVLPALIRFLRGEQPPPPPPPVVEQASTKSPSHHAISARLNVGAKAGSPFAHSVERVRQWLLTMPLRERLGLVTKCMLESGAADDTDEQDPDDYQFPANCLSPLKLQRITEKLLEMLPVEQAVVASPDQEECNGSEHKDSFDHATTQFQPCIASKPHPVRGRRLTLPTSGEIDSYHNAALGGTCGQKRSLFRRARRVSDDSFSRSGGDLDKPGWLETEYRPHIHNVLSSWSTMHNSVQAVEDVSFRLHRRLSALPRLHLTVDSTAPVSSLSDPLLQPTVAELDLLRASFGGTGPAKELLDTYRRHLQGESPLTAGAAAASGSDAFTTTKTVSPGMMPRH